MQCASACACLELAWLKQEEAIVARKAVATASARVGRKVLILCPFLIRSVVFQLLRLGCWPLRRP